MIGSVVSRTASLFASFFDNHAGGLPTEATGAHAQAGRPPKPDPLRYLPPPGLAGWSALPERDRRLLEWMAVAEVVTAELAAVLAYGSLRVAQRRLARLREYRLIDGFWTANAQRPRGRYAYQLTERCRTELERLIWADWRPPRPARGDQRSTIHHLAVHDLLTAFLRAAEPDRGLVAWLPERICAALFDGYLRPDAMAAIRVAGRLVVAFIERDTGSERIAILGAKVRRYRAVLGSRPELQPAHVVFVTDSGRRARSIMSAFQAAGGNPGPQLWTTIEREVLSAPWSAMWRSAQHGGGQLDALAGHLLPRDGVILTPGCLLAPDQSGALDERALELLPMLEQLRRRSGL